MWNSPIPSNAALDPRSASYAANVRQQLTTAQPWLNTADYSSPVYTVPADQPRVQVKLDVAWNNDLREAWAGVPIPLNAKPARGTDKHMVVWQPSTDTMWEFWLMDNKADGWHARWGGRMTNVSTNPGHFESPSYWGATATSLPLLAGMMRLDELAAGRINHALAFALPNTRAEWFTAPAQRTDGNIYSADAIPEGARFRIDPKVDLSKRTMLPIVRMMAEAAQRYGMILRDKSGAVTFYAEDPTPTGTDPFVGGAGYFKGQWVNQVLRDQFPWEHLQVMKTDQTCCWTR